MAADPDPDAEKSLPTLDIDPSTHPDAPKRDRICLTVMTGTATGHVYPVVPGSNVIGRSLDAEIQIIGDGISRQHARIRHDGEVLYLEDMESRNGTFLNGRRITEPTALTAGDKIQIATTVMRFAFHDELDDSFHESLLQSAMRDPLTKLFNKRYLMERLDSELQFARRHDTSLSVLMIDLDHFKRVNDGHGHLAGDAVLSQLADVLVGAVRNEDVVARFGGEELVIILRAIPIDPAFQLGERLRGLVEATVTTYQGRDLKTTISVGAAGFPTTNAETVAQLLEAADQALYRAKNGGRNRVCR